MARVLVVGGGGREHTLATFLGQSPEVETVFTAPGNAGTPHNVPIDVMAEGGFDALKQFAIDRQIDLTVVGPEAPLCAGLADLFRREGLAIFGPGQAAAALEADKAFAREFMERQGIPGPRYRVFEQLDRATEYLSSLDDEPVVVKAAGLAAGKGAIVCRNRREALTALERIMGQRVFGAAGDKVVIEECMRGEEASILALCDGENAVYLPSSQDHKRALEGDRGPNTGGMGAYAPAPVVTPAVQEIVDRRIVRPTLRGLIEAGTPYRGCLYVGLMIDQGRPRVVEYNCRFGDPETQAVLPLLESDLFSLLRAAATATLAGHTVRTSGGAACCVVLASGGYPNSYEKGKEISGLADAEREPGTYVFHAATRGDEAGRVLTAGGRVLGVTGTGSTIRPAIEAAYRAAERIRFQGCHYRGDIGFRAWNRQGP